MIKAFEDKYRTSEFQLTLLHAMGEIIQMQGEAIDNFYEQVIDLQDWIVRSLSIGIGVVDLDWEESRQMKGIASLTFKSFIFGVYPKIQKYLSYKNLKTFKDALKAARKMEPSINNVVVYKMVSIGHEATIQL